MKLFSVLSMIFLGLPVYANPSVCFEDKQEVTIQAPGQTTGYTLTNKGEVRKGSQKFANLPLPKGFVGECLVTAPIKTDTLVVLSMTAVDYDEKNAFIFRISSKDLKVLWSLHLKSLTEPRIPYITEKVILIPSIGEVVAVNPEMGTVRWKFNSPETEGVNFKKISIDNFIVHAEGIKIAQESESILKFELNSHNGKLAPIKKNSPTLPSP